MHLIPIKILLKKAKMITRKLTTSDSFIIEKAVEIYRQIHILLEAFQTRKLSIAFTIVKNLAHMLIFIKNQRCIAQNIENQYLSESLKQKTIKLYLDKIQSRLDQFQKNKVVAKSMSDELTIQNILKIIQQQKDVCLECLKQVEDGRPFPKTTQLFSLANGKSINEILQDYIKKKVCALLNAQGGYLFISQSINKDSVIGIKLDNLELYQLRQFVIKTINNSIFPNTFEIKIDTLKVTKQNNKTSKAILRVSLLPGKGNGFYFVKKEVLNYPSVYSCYFLDLKAVGKINDVCVLKQAKCIYEILIKHRNLKHTEQIVHKFSCISRNNAMENILHSINRHYPGLGDLEKIIDAGPKIKYRNQSIAILQSEADDKYIPLIKRAFENYKMLFQLSKSYELCRKNSIKSMWFISHQQDLVSLQSIIADVIANKNKTFTLITLTKYILIEKRQLSCLKAYKSTFQSFFQKDLTIYGELLDSSTTKQQLYDMYIKFDSFSEAYFSFMLLDDHRIRSKFIKQNKFKFLKKTQLNIS